MLRAMVRSAPVTPRMRPQKPPLNVATINENLFYSEVPNADQSSTKGTPKREVPQALALFPTEKLVPVLYGFAKALWLDSERRGFLKAKFLAKLQRQRDSSSILKSEHTLLTYMNWAIGHVEKAGCSVVKETRELQLEIAEQMLKALTSMDTQGHNANVPNSYILGLTHLHLALVWMLRKHQTRVAAHLLEMFVVCPKYARQNFAPEVWEQVFRPYLTGIQTWHRREYNNITTPFRSLSRATQSSAPGSPMPFAVRANKLRQSELRSINSKHTSRTMEKKDLTDSKRSDKFLQVNLLHDLYEETLDESTQQYAQRYQELVISYEGRDHCGQLRSSKLSARTGVPNLSPEEHRSPFRIGMKTQYVHIGDERRRSISEGCAEGKPLQLRRSLYEAVFGAHAGHIQERSQLHCLCSSHQVLDHKALVGEPTYKPLKKTRNKLFQNYSPPSSTEEWELQPSDSTFHKRYSSDNKLPAASKKETRVGLSLMESMTPKAHRSRQPPAARDSNRLIDLIKESDQSQMTLPSQYITRRKDYSTSGEHRRRGTTVREKVLSTEEQFLDIAVRAGTWNKARRKSFSTY